MLKVSIIGNLGGDAEVRQVGDQSVIAFNVAHNERYTDRQTGQQQERTQWVRCSYWRDPNRTRVAEFLKKGTQVYIEGNLTLSQYTRQDGTQGAGLDCRVNYLELLSGGVRSEDGGAGGGYNAGMGGGGGGYAPPQQQQAPQQSPPPAGNSDGGETADDDLPF